MSNGCQWTDCKGNRQGNALKKDAPKWRNGRRAGFKIRSTQVGEGSSPSFGINDLCRIAKWPRKAVPPISFRNIFTEIFLAFLLQVLTLFLSASFKSFGDGLRYGCKT